MKTFTRLLLLAALLPLSSCSHFSQSNRQQRAYAKYVRNSSVTRARQQVKYRKSKAVVPPAGQPSERSISAESGPQAMGSDGQ